MGRVEILAAAAGLLLILKAPALAQYPIGPGETAETSSASASAAHDEGQTSAAKDEAQASRDYEDQTSSDTGESQALADTDWWLQNDGLTVGYLAGWYGAGSCGSWSQPNRAWQPYTMWWSGGGMSPWFPAGSLGRFSNQSGWCNHYGYGNRSPYGLWVNRIPIPAKKPHHTWNRKSGNKSNNEMRATGEQAPRELKPNDGGPDDDWTRVEDHIEHPHTQQIAALQRRHDQAIRGLQRGPRPQNPQRAHAERMQGLERRHLAQARGFGGMHSSARPAAHIAARSGGRGHS